MGEIGSVHGGWKDVQRCQVKTISMKEISRSEGP